MRSEVQEYREVTRDMESQLGRPPTRDELIAEVALRQEMRDREIRHRQEEERDRFVQVMFHGHSRQYTYQLDVANRGLVKVGDYVMVFSPLTEQSELVRVVELGKGSWLGGFKIAHRIEWSVI